MITLSFTQNIVRACSMFYPYEGYRSVTPLDAARVYIFCVKLSIDDHIVRLVHKNHRILYERA